jgi:hypothetical protein
MRVFAGAELCLVGFVPNKRVALRITAPDGKVERKTVIDKEYVSDGTYHYHSDYYFSRRPKDPVGDYRVLATQGTLRASLTITLLPTAEPMMYYSIQKGEIEVSGLKARQRLILNFYGGPGQSTSFPEDPSGDSLDYLLPYLGSMNVVLDENGQGSFSWPDALRKGCYGVDFKRYGLSKPVQCHE